ncbi:hypothetical protein ACEZCY_14740 [Streptacidiphilus sp. N1-12]|uniref:HK97 gp10 family phage protein n=2 Tax=Streptacidiphilus alkalitolerans TaxID=3342712 RepID=A0ABV6VA09_9ACTN
MDDIGMRVEGTRDLGVALTAMQRRIDLATVKALKKSQSLTRNAIRGRMRARPRWDHRGASRRTGPAVSLDLTPHHVSRRGGPGKLSGALAASIRSSKRPRVKGQALSAVVMSGGAGGPQNLYKARIEGSYPYFRPGAQAAEKKIAPVWAEEWYAAVLGRPV